MDWFWPRLTTDDWVDHADLLDVSAQARSWLMAQGSLTARLRTCCHQFRVIPALSRRVQLYPDESRWFERADPIWGREVSLMGDGSSWVFARSLWPVNKITQPLCQLTDQPLGELLFADHGNISSTIPRQVAHFEQHGQSLLLRRSLYRYHGVPVLVQELFLPESPIEREAFS